MDLAFFTKDILINAIVFAPAVVLLGTLCFLGLTSLLERSGVLGAAPTRLTLATQSGALTNPQPGRIVSELRAAISEQAPERNTVAR